MADDAVVRGATMRLLAAEDLRRLSRRGDARGALPLGVHLAAIAASPFALAAAWRTAPLLRAPAGGR